MCPFDSVLHVSWEWRVKGVGWPGFHYTQGDGANCGLGKPPIASGRGHRDNVVALLDVGDGGGELELGAVGSCLVEDARYEVFVASFWSSIGTGVRGGGFPARPSERGLLEGEAKGDFKRAREAGEGGGHAGQQGCERCGWWRSGVRQLE